MSKWHSTSRWRRMRALKLAHQPLCELCLMNGRVTVASHVHHILAIKDFPQEETALNMMYLQSLCRECHEEIDGSQYKTGGTCIPPAASTLNSRRSQQNTRGKIGLREKLKDA